MYDDPDCSITRRVKHMLTTNVQRRRAQELAAREQEKKLRGGEEVGWAAKAWKGLEAKLPRSQTGSSAPDELDDLLIQPYDFPGLPASTDIDVDAAGVSSGAGASPSPSPYSSSAGVTLTLTREM